MAYGLCPLSPLLTREDRRARLKGALIAHRTFCECTAWPSSLAEPMGPEGFRVRRGWSLNHAYSTPPHPPSRRPR